MLLARSILLILDTFRCTMFLGAYFWPCPNDQFLLTTDVYLLYRYERSWGHLFESFEAFLAFSWPVITVTDATTGRAHIVTRLNSIGAFIKMIKTRCLYLCSLFPYLTISTDAFWAGSVRLSRRLLISYRSLHLRRSLAISATSLIILHIRNYIRPYRRRCFLLLKRAFEQESLKL